jgi:hypothetical protein
MKYYWCIYVVPQPISIISLNLVRAIQFPLLMRIEHLVVADYKL